MISGQTVRIYIAEDSRLLVGALRLHIKEIYGLECVGQAATGEKATADILALRPDLVLLDITLQESDGFDVLERIRHSDHPTVVAMMTFEPSAALRNRAAALGAHLFFDKASEAGALLDLLQNLGKGKLTLASLIQPNPQAQL